jgi:hypothetical protein
MVVKVKWEAKPREVKTAVTQIHLCHEERKLDADDAHFSTSFMKLEPDGHSDNSSPPDMGIQNLSDCLLSAGEIK